MSSPVLSRLLASTALTFAAGCTTPAPTPSQSPAVSESATVSQSRTRKSISPGPARVTLTADKPQFLLGENVLIHYCLENTGALPITISVGGDYRGSSRSLRFQVTVTGEDGEVAEDPDPTGFNMGGLGYSPEIKPGESFCQSLPLLRYARIDKPGATTITVTHDLGWDRDAGAAPTGTLVLRFETPNDREAAQVVDEALALSTDKSWSAGKKRAPYADLTLLRAPVYLPALESRGATRKDRAAEIVEAIGAIESPAATSTLIRLAQSPDAAVALAAAKALAARLPDIEFAKQVARGSFVTGRDVARKRLIDTSYRPEHAAPAREAGTRLLASSDLMTSATGAFILQCVGEKADLPALAEALGRAIGAMQSAPPKGQDYYGSPRGVSAQIQRSVAIFAERGFLPDRDPKTAGEMAAWLAALHAKESFRPSGWERVMARAAAHPIPYVRELTMEATMKPAPSGVVARIPMLVGDADRDVQIAACLAAERLEDKTLAKPILSALTKSRDDRVVRTCQHAAWMLGARVEALRLAASRLDETDVGSEMRSFLTSVLEDTNGYSADAMNPAQAANAKARWLAFIAANEAELRRGARFSVADPRIMPDMFPAMKLHRKDGSTWP